ncbi:MAG: polysaccharide deacetylase family protein [Bacteroidia bacterium]|nr:polysaccharide deacetylase family protein [Bacteroidia bacterium]
MYDALGLEFRITQEGEEFERYQGPKINYSSIETMGGVQIKPHTILYDHGIRDYHLEVFQHKRLGHIFFRNSETGIPFDLFGASFWLISRYEEYLPFKADQHGRFQYSSSLAYQYDFLHVPLVNLWLFYLRDILKEQFPKLEFRQRNYNFVSTIDVDNAYKYKYKGFVRTLAGVLGDGSLKKIKNRFKIILNKAKDPFDAYDFLIKAHSERRITSLFFFLVGDYGPNDKNHSASDLRFQSLIKHVADYSSVGLHPSYGSNASLRQLKVELSRISTITHRIINSSRQHFSVLKFPKTYLDLLQAGLENDYSMGYTNKNGFRASYCYPYKWYMLETESVSPLELHPFCISENTLLHEVEENKTELKDLAQPYIQEVKKYGGELVSIFHNNNFNVKLKKFYLEFLDMAK